MLLQRNTTKSCFHGGSDGKSHTPNALAGVRAVLGLPVKTAGTLQKRKTGAAPENRKDETA